MLHHAQDVQIHKVMPIQLTSSMTVEALKQWVSTMRMMGFTVPSAKTMAQSRADIVNAIIFCDQASRRQPTLKGGLGLYTLAGQARPAHSGCRVRLPILLRQAAWSTPPPQTQCWGQ